MSQNSNDDPFPGKPLGDGLYEVDLSQLEDVVYFRPGMPNFDSADVATAPSEPITKTTKLNPVDVVIFYDRFSWHPLSEGCNQWAFVVDDRRALFSRYLVHSIKLSRLRKKPNAIAIRRIPTEFAENVASFLVRCRWRPSLFKAAINHLQCNNYMPFITGSFYPPDIWYDNDEDYNYHWDLMVSRLEPHDLIFTFDRTSYLSALIAKITHGPFSHVATYIGGGKIWEVVTSGARIVPIEIYKDRHKYRVAAYRHSGFEQKPREQQLEEMKAQVGNVKYGYLGALGAGIKTYFGWHRESGSPNGLILGGPFLFIQQS